MIDIQNQADERDVPLAKVGVKGLQYPIRVLDKVNSVQYTTAKVDLFADLPHHFKGTHMSRFIEIFHRHKDDISMPRFLEMLRDIRRELDAESAFGTVAFPYFLEKKAPVSGLPGMLSYECRYHGSVRSDGKHFTVSVAVPVTTVCPCSKAISDRGAHNQRGIVTVEVELGPFFWIEDLITIVENAASSPVYSLLKREDEKFITEAAYDNPKFVEDLVRDVYIKIKELEQFPRFSVEAENFESIHNHSAFAYAMYDPQAGKDGESFPEGENHE
ncbi:GTP cyclohydrolase FolE2 [Breznakiella homolactica]|uniref:GTP cyclohydrolase FolE2 n=1 Tax=Breznakiella homolactica TaxID=2798577 RepID=A0A7T7XJJ4_9SPIR|nr:GTP cyclohydrolase FolE2 [Breznakiella homolactica]QQO07541.1 GTP cyclohydrolase FolE2 [Breznakiella homolactica]